MNINKDTIVAIFLLLFCGIMINNSFEIEDPGYQGMKASFWPTVILYLLSVMCLVMLIKSVVYKTDNNLYAIDENTSNIFLKFKNALILFFYVCPFFNISRLLRNVNWWYFICIWLADIIRWKFTKKTF